MASHIKVIVILEIWKNFKCSIIKCETFLIIVEISWIQERIRNLEARLALIAIEKLNSDSIIAYLVYLNSNLVNIGIIGSN